MKFTCESAALVDALSRVAKAATTKGLPILAGVHLSVSDGHLNLLASDTELTLSDRIAVTDSEDGVVVIPAKVLTDVARGLPAGPSTWTIAENEAVVTAGRSEFAVRVLPAAEYPAMPEAPADGVTIDAADLATALRQVVPAASADEKRPILAGVLFDASEACLRIVGTDSYRLAVCDTAVDTSLFDGKSVIIPARALTEVSRALKTGDVNVHFGENIATFVTGSFAVSTRLIVGDYPAYRGIIPKSNPNLLTVVAADLVEGLSRVKLMAREANVPLVLDMSTEAITLRAMTRDVGKASEVVDGDYSGDALSVSVNPEFLIAAINAVGADKVVLAFSDSMKPLTVTSLDGGGFLALVMPVRAS